MRVVDSSTTQQNCTNTEGELVRFFASEQPKNSDTSTTSSKVMKFVPSKLQLRRGTVYIFKVVVRVRPGVTKCYSKAREASREIGVAIAKGAQGSLLPLNIVICSKYPCKCSSPTTRRRFNLGSKVVLRACSTHYVQKHAWKATSLASLGAASFTSSTGDGTRRQEFATVVLNSAISQNVLEP